VSGRAVSFEANEEGPISLGQLTGNPSLMIQVPASASALAMYRLSHGAGSSGYQTLNMKKLSKTELADEALQSPFARCGIPVARSDKRDHGIARRKDNVLS
jgi:hypothetical protein